MDLEDHLRTLREKLKYFKRLQQLAGNGGTLPNNLDELEMGYQAYSKFLLQMYQRASTEDNFRHQIGNVQLHIGSLIKKNFIIEKQPPQVLKTNTQFAVTVRLLGGSSLNIASALVAVKIISEKQAVELKRSNDIETVIASGEIVNNIATLEYNQALRRLQCSFQNMKLKKIKRAPINGSKPVLDQKFALLFRSQIVVCGGMLVNVWALSLPVVVIVHGNQEAQASATISWDNAFPVLKRQPFQVKEMVSWWELADLLKTKFRAYTGCELSEDHLQYLAEKVLLITSPVDPHAIVTYKQFCKELLPARSFTFWEWFYAAMKMAREKLKPLWIDGLIMGFVGRLQVEEMLLKKCAGTFLVRFTDSVLGGISIAFVQSGYEVVMLDPLTIRDLTLHSLADTLRDIQQCQFLYPGISKDQAFERHYTPPMAALNENGYLRTSMRICVTLPRKKGLSNSTSNSSLSSIRSNTSTSNNSASSFPSTSSPPTIPSSDLGNCSQSLDISRRKKGLSISTSNSSLSSIRSNNSTINNLASSFPSNSSPPTIPSSDLGNCSQSLDIS